MFEIPEMVRTAQDLARYATARQTVVAENIANADTPGYRARDLRDFSAVYGGSDSALQMQTTRAGHMAGSAGPQLDTEVVFRDAEMSPNGNTVSLETEMIKSAELRHQHDMAVAAYKSALDLMRVAIGRGR